ncbi:hypothetical protein [Flavobacterium sp.]|uniref:hypothetical protein n=1 Tax=Flavobacterium sp. TaxID=239 RepID=UPI002638F881|nr:hypothetical protein [Flavobacterium sp.]MDG2431691.1 hypothetical protein [Flavobacterium sp.]
MDNKKSKIEALKANGYQLEFENVFNLAFENYKKIALYAGLMIFVFSILISILLVTGLISYFGVTGFVEAMKPENLNAASLSESSNLVIMIGTVIVVCLLSPFPAGLIKMAHAAQEDEEFHVSTVFTYYAAPYFKELVLATLLIGIFSTALSTAISYLDIPFLEILISTAVSFVTMLTLPLIIFSDLKATEAIISSLVLVFKQPLTLLGLFVVSYIASLIGIFGCCIGIFFTMPFMYSLYFAAYSQIVGFDAIDDQVE